MTYKIQIPTPLLPYEKHIRLSYSVVKTEGLRNPITKLFLLPFMKVDEVTQMAERNARTRKRKGGNARKKTQKQMKGDSNTKHRFPSWNHSKINE